MSRNKPKHISTFGARITSIISVTLVLMLLGIVAITAAMARFLTDDIRSNLGFVVQMERGCQESDINSVKRMLASSPFVERFTYSSPDDILAEESQYLGEEISGLLDANPYSAEFDIKINAEYTNVDSIEVAVTHFELAPGVKKVITDRNIIKEVDSTLQRVSSILLLVTAALLLISLVLINNTVSLSIYSRRFLIHTMRLVGATKSFIRRPFIIAGATNGLISGVIASIILLFVRTYTATLAPSIEQALGWGQIIVIDILLITIGIIICATTAAIATNRYLSLSYDEMFKQ